MTKKEILKALKEGKVLVWNDPDPIEGNDYVITNVHEIDDETALIHYGGGSEAEVYLSEISIAKTRFLAMRWWHSLPDYANKNVLHGGKHGLCTHYYNSRMWQSLTGREIEKIWNYEKQPEMGKVKEFTQEVESMLFNIYSAIGMDRPANHDEILTFVADDVLETADPLEWHSGDVGIAFRRWIEAQGTQPDENPEPKEVIKIGDKINTIGELRSIISNLDNMDIICIETIDLNTGDAIDLYPMYVDVIDGIELTDGTIVQEVRFCQMMNSVPDTRDKQPIIDALIKQTIADANDGDTTVIDETLKHVPYEILLHSLPEENWDALRTNIPFEYKPIWSQINSDHEDDDKIFIDAWLSDDDNENGVVIAKVDINTNEVIYFDERAKTDKYAQEVITECFKRL